MSQPGFVVTGLFSFAAASRKETRVFAVPGRVASKTIDPVSFVGVISLVPREDYDLVGPRQERINVRIELDHSVVRSLRPDDAESLAGHADNRNVWINLRDAFPHPYTRADAETFIARSLEPPETTFAIDVDGEAAGAIGFLVGKDVERRSAEIGYWLGEPYWNRGIMTDVVAAVTEFAMDEHELTRVFATPYGWNKASMRVLEKAGYVLEGVMSRAAIKAGKIVDKHLYAFVPGSSAPEMANAEGAADEVVDGLIGEVRGDRDAP